MGNDDCHHSRKKLFYKNNCHTRTNSQRIHPDCSLDTNWKWFVFSVTNVFVEGPNSADEKTASTPKRVSVEISSSSTSHQSGIYNTLDTGNDQQNYAELNDRHQYEDMHDGRQIYMQNIQNEQVIRPKWNCIWKK